MSVIDNVRVRTVLALGALTLVCAGVTACGSGGSGPQPVAQVTSMAAAMTPPIPMLTPADINAAILVGFDPNTPAAQKNDWIQGGGKSGLGSRLAQVAGNNKVKVTVTAVRYVGDGVMDAIADILANGQSPDGQTTIPFVVEDGRWKLQMVFACRMLASAQLTSPACP